MSIYGKVLSNLTTSAGTRVTKYLQEGNVLKEIKYAPNSRMAKMGIDKVLIEKAGEQGKRMVVFSPDKCLMVGKTKPSWKYEQSILDQLREYINAAKVMLENGVKLG